MSKKSSQNASFFDPTNYAEITRRDVQFEMGPGASNPSKKLVFDIYWICFSLFSHVCQKLDLQTGFLFYKTMLWATHANLVFHFGPFGPFCHFGPFSHLGPLGSAARGASPLIIVFITYSPSQKENMQRTTSTQKQLQSLYVYTATYMYILKFDSV